jgi:type IV pilus assembly protein PilQ
MIPLSTTKWTRKWSRTASLLFLAAAAVYDGQGLAVEPTKITAPPPTLFGNNGTEARQIAEEPSPTTKPAANGEQAKDAGPTTAPSVGKSVTASEVAVSKDSGTVEIHVNDANLVEVLRMLSMQSNTNILPSKDVRGTVTANLYDVTIKEALDAILEANGYGYREKGNVIYVMSAKEIADDAKLNRKQATKVFHLYYTPAANAQTMIKPVLSSDGQVAVTTPAQSGIDSTGKDTGGNAHAVEDMMVVTDYPENLERVEKILKDVDKRPQQILVEATILRASLNENNSLGVDFTLLGGVNFNQFPGTEQATSTQALQGTLIDPGSKNAKTGYAGGGTGFTQGLPTGGLRVGFVYNNIAAFIQALEEVTDTTVMANPKILMLNKQKGEVKVARQDPFRGKTTTTETGLTQQEVDFLETGTLLIIRPYIGDDGYIRMEVHPEDSTPLPSTAADLPPTKLTTESTSNIMVKDGHTIVIGGLFRETAQSSKSQVPFFGNIPILGNLLKKQTDTTQREEVIILLTPHIVKDDDAFSRASEAEAKEAEKLRVGTRHGMMPWGRERLAETSYEQAVAELNKPNPDRKKAMWHLNCATNLNPKFVEAIDLKQKISGKEVTTADNSSIRNFVRQQIMTDRAPAAIVVPVAPATQPTAGSPTTQPTTATAGTPAKLPTPATKPAAQASAVDPSEDSFDEELDPATPPAPSEKALKSAQASKPAKPAEPKPEAKTDATVSIKELLDEEIKTPEEKSGK